jgi:hypothetical protein
VSAKMVGYLSLSHSRSLHSCGITIIYNTLGTCVSKRQQICNVLERFAYNYLVNYKALQDLPNQQEMES